MPRFTITTAGVAQPRKPNRLLLTPKAMMQLRVGAGDLVVVNDRRVLVAWPSSAFKDAETSLSHMASSLLAVEPGNVLVVTKFLGTMGGDAKHVEVTLPTAASADAPVDEKQRLEAFAKLARQLVHVSEKFELPVDGVNGEAVIIKHDMPAVKPPSNTATPTTIFTITEESQFTLKSTHDAGKKTIEAKDPNAVTFSSIGGLSEQVRIVREMIELPLTKPELFAKYGIRPPRGVLLYGPPGSGKTLIARAVAAEIRAHVITINGAEIVSKYVGETEASLRALFAEAVSRSPALVFIDEIDALCPKREDASNETERRVVATLLTLMDGMDSVHQVCVIGATNRPNSLDQALRRAGRFDKEVEIGIPDAKGRLEILRIHLSKVPNGLKPEEIELVAKTTHGYVGADLAALCREATMLAIDRAFREPTTDDASNNLVNIHDLLRAKGAITPSAMREISLEVPEVRWSDIGGNDELKQKLRECIEWPVERPEVFRRLGISPPKGILLYGPPGCSKTLMAKAIATESGLNFFAIKGPEVFSKWVGDSERAIKELFRKARAASPSIVFFDEIDAIATKRGSGGESGGGGTSVADRVLTQLLTEMDGVESLANVLVVAATNRPDIIDPALLRPGRFDRLLYVPPPDRPSRRRIFELRLAKAQVGDDVDLDRLADLSARMSGAEIVALCQEAALLAINHYTANSMPLEQVVMKQTFFEQALTLVKPRITDSVLEYYRRFEKAGA